MNHKLNSIDVIIEKPILEYSSDMVVNSKFGPIIVNINDKYISNDILNNRYWAESDIELIRQLLIVRLRTKNTVVFYDVGANIGTHALAMSKLFGDRVKIRAFEAQSKIFNMMLGTIALNNISNIDSHWIAVSDSIGQTLELELPDYSKPNNFGGFELVKPRHTDNQDMIRSGLTEQVSTTTLDLFNETVDFIKMDIEGMEHLAINGAICTIEKGRPMCFIEIKKTDAEKVFGFFRSRNYKIYLKADNAIFIPNEEPIIIEGLHQVN